jgi:hypothetical protein
MAPSQIRAYPGRTRRDVERRRPGLAAGTPQPTRRLLPVPLTDGPPGHSEASAPRAINRDWHSGMGRLVLWPHRAVAYTLLRPDSREQRRYVDDDPCGVAPRQARAGRRFFAGAAAASAAGRAPTALPTLVGGRHPRVVRSPSPPDRAVSAQPLRTYPGSPARDVAGGRYGLAQGAARPTGRIVAASSGGVGRASGGMVERSWEIGRRRPGKWPRAAKGYQKGSQEGG